MTATSANTDGVIRLLEELAAWARFQNREAMRRTLTEVLSTENDRRIYELTDGSRTGSEIARAVGVSKSAVSLKWKAWRVAGLLTEGDKGPRHLASFESIGGRIET